MWKSTVDSSRSQMTIWHMHIVCWIPKATNTLTVNNTYCSSTAWTVAQTCLSVMLYVHCLSCRSYHTQLFLEWEMFQTKVVEKIKTHILRYITFFFSKMVAFMRKCWIMLYSWAGHRWKYGACALHAGYLSLQMHTQNMSYLLVFHCNNSCTNMLQCYVIWTLPTLLKFSGSKSWGCGMDGTGSWSCLMLNLILPVFKFRVLLPEWVN